MKNYKKVDGSAFLKIRNKYDILEAEIKMERDSFQPYWRDLSKFILPRRSRFYQNDVNNGARKNTDIIDSTASLASRTLSSGMMTGITSPARNWFKLTTDNPELNRSDAVKEYFQEVTERIRSAFLKSNLYNVLPTFYGDLGTFSTGCFFMEEDMESVFNFISLPIGSYGIANNRKGMVNVFFREFQMTVRQIVETFGRESGEGSIDWTSISEVVKQHWETNQLETKIDITHFVTPNEDYDSRRLESKYKRYKSVYYESGSSKRGVNMYQNVTVPHKFLKEAGYDYFPALAGRWEVTGEDTYGTNGPGMICLGDVKQLQLAEKRIMQAIDQKVRPSMVGPTALKTSKASMIPGDITYVDIREGAQGIRRLFEVDFDTRELEMKQNQVRERISRAFYEDLFLMLAQSDRRQITAREIDERHEEKLLALGPVLERVNQDVLDPLIQNAYLIMDKQGRLPEVPQELQGVDYKVEYISIMAQAQKIAGIGNVERFLGFVGNTAGIDPSAVDKVNINKAIDEYGEHLGVNQKVIRSDDEVAEIQAQRAQQQQAMQEAAMAQEAVNAAKTMSETELDNNSALDQLLGGVSG